MEPSVSRWYGCTSVLEKRGVTQGAWRSVRTNLYRRFHLTHRSAQSLEFIMSSRYVLTRWEPEQPDFWKAEGQRVAQRNLWISIPALMLAFSVWMLWSVVVVNLNKAGFHFSKNQMFWLTALPALSGATLRIFYSFLVPIFGGRRWTALSTASLLLPALGMGFALQDTSTSYPTL